ncbi:glycosyltransferase N-terminal domain-containing protein [Paracoccus sp. MBLB3053]|uniref:3-deoxy-D-manno-octulosonic acid transferase n=1 Tax=Paracoccus aurantius TaxID=3073814 RepID=A0ABU2HNK0_9RHOB|nr:glycosyltransferase N-terminal domain-containing protein [Paracoccus sp. MBLB3053]MDS9466613.1 glycosyltransferase N-terminal domain-containing protein [Paracoccus sp. MBLB3053]
MIWRGATALAGLALRGGSLLSGPDLRERLALSGPPITPGGIWLHAASVGELNSARVLAKAMAAERPLTITTNSTTGRALAGKLGYPATLAPLDVPQAVARFLARVEPSVLVTVENELWPNRSAMAGELGVAQVVVGARISERSAARWAKVPWLIGPMLKRIDVLSAQDEASEERLLRLGLPSRAVAGRLNLKLLGPAKVTPPEDGPMRARTVLAASTHEGEDEIVLDAYLSARAAIPDLRFILAPRHPERGGAIAAMLAARGLEFGRRSRGDGREAQILLADTLGEMADWYAAAGICITCGSFTDRGGHTPWEPAASRCAILYGPNVSNHAPDYRDLAGAGAAMRCDPGDLALRLSALAQDVPAQRRMGQAARALLLERAGDPSPLISRIRSFARGSLA